MLSVGQCAGFGLLRKNILCACDIAVVVSLSGWLHQQAKQGQQCTQEQDIMATYLWFLKTLLKWSK